MSGTLRQRLARFRVDRSKSWAAVLASAVVVVGCDTSGSGGRASDAGRSSAPARDGAGEDASQAPDGARRCSPFGKPVCASGETCCLSGFIGTCEGLGSCKTSTQFECSQSNTCPTGNLCCGTFEERSDGGSIATTFCQKSCVSPAHAICLTTADCTTGEVCTILPEGSNSPVLAAAVESFEVCKPFDGGARP